MEEQGDAQPDERQSRDPAHRHQRRGRRVAPRPLRRPAPTSPPAAPGSARPAGTAPGRRPAPPPSRTAARGSFSRHFRQIVSRSAVTCRLTLRGRLRRPLPHLLERLQHRVGLERRPAGQRRVEDRPQAVDVGRRRDRAPATRRPAPGSCTTASPRSSPRPTASPSPSIRLASPKSVTCGLALARRAGCSRA